jgi:hypothetical protein
MGGPERVAGRYFSPCASCEARKIFRTEPKICHPAVGVVWSLCTTMTSTAGPQSLASVNGEK